MKIRMGFVSNSSSSSFCIVGVVVNDSNFGENIDIETLENKAWDNKLNVERGIANYYEKSIIGLCIYNMKDNQTLGEFKDLIYEKLKNIGYVDKKDKIDILIDGGYDG